MSLRGIWNSLIAGFKASVPSSESYLGLSEGLEETLTVHRLKIPGLLRETLCSTNPMESASSACRGIIRRVSNFKDGEMVLRHAAAGFMGAEQGFHRVRGYKHMGVLLAMLEIETVDQTAIKTA